MSEEPVPSESNPPREFNATKMWHKAMELLRVHSFDVSDPWADFSLNIETTEASRHRFSAIKKKWITDRIQVKIESEPFDRGAMRQCFKMKKLPSNGQWGNASNYVAKHYIDKVDRNVYFEDVKLQMEAKLWGEAYNRLNPPKKVDIFQLSIIEVEGPDGEKKMYHIERYMEGDYRKYNSNSGFVDEKIRNTPQAFSHFTFERSGHRLMVVDIQGVGDLYTDPQIHTSDGVGYSDGNLGLRGMALFFHSHRCNPICEWLGLAPFDLSELEVLQKHPTLVKMDTEKGNELESAFLADEKEDAIIHEFDLPHNNSSRLECDLTNLSMESANDPYDRRRKSFDNSHESPFPENISTPRIVSRRRRTVSYNHSSTEKPDKIVDIIKTSNNGSIESFQRVFGSTVKRSSEESLLSFQSTNMRRKDDSISSNSAEPNSPFINGEIRNRAHSGDSGISGHGAANGNVKPSVSFDLNSNPSTLNNSHKGDIISNVNNLPFNMPRISRRNRTISESSDVDADEGMAFFGNNFPHQMMTHENQKPSCADHPTNLDQEIGQSILGQIHHELARLHEAGRFIKQKDDGGWSCGIALANKDCDSDSSQSSGEYIKKIDWVSVIFHEKNAAQLGCLEAMIVMAHYYLGLPTTLLYDCPIKAGLEEVGMGMDYLWKAAEGGDRRCMILLARYLDTYATGKLEDDSDNLEEFQKFMTTPKDLIVLPRLAEAISAANKLDGLVLGLSSIPAQKPWSEAMHWYKRAVDTAAQECPVDEGFDAEGRYDSASDLLTPFRLLARMAEMYLIGGHGIMQDFCKSGEIFNLAAEKAMSSQEGQLAMKYFELSDEAYAMGPEEDTEEATA